MLGSAIVRALKARGYEDIVTEDHNDFFDLINPGRVNRLFQENIARKQKIDYVFMAAGKVGGIQANIDHPAQFLGDNARMAMNVIDACKEYGAKLCYIGSSCVYPRECPQPMKEEYLLTGRLEPTNEGYALGKIIGLKYAQYALPDSLLAMPCNLYGTNDHYGENGHVLASLVRRFVDAVDNNLPAVTLWGTGSARREFLHVDDCADALVFLMERGEHGMINVGSGFDVTILALANTIALATEYQGEILWDTAKPDGMPRKLLDTTRLDAMGWRRKVTLEEGIQRTVAEYRATKERA